MEFYIHYHDVCSTWFLDIRISTCSAEKPSSSPNDPDYVPSIFVFSNNTTAINKQYKSRWKWLANRRHKNNYQLHETRVSSKNSETIIIWRWSYWRKFWCWWWMYWFSWSQVECISDGQILNTTVVHDENSIDSVNEQDIPISKQDKSLITDVDWNAWESLMQQMSVQQELIGMLKSELKVVISPTAKMEGDDEQTHFYTELPSYAVFSSLLDLLLSVMSKRTSHGLSPQDQFLLVLMKLRLAVPGKDLGYRFGVSPTRVSQIFHEWINTMSRELKQLIKWPDRELIRKTLPDYFKSKYPRATCIINCLEIFIERATSLSARSESYSNNKSHNIAKFLVAISPTGTIIFVSKCWGGRASNKIITSKCGFLDWLLNGDVVLADREFDIVEDLALRRTALAIPPFTKGKSQLS